MYCVDVETKGLSPWRAGNELYSIVGKIGEFKADKWYRDAIYSTQAVHKNLRGSDTLVAHNAAFDISWLETFFKERFTGKIFDTSVACHLLNENVSASLDACAQRYLGEEKFDPGVKPEMLWTLPLEKLLEYNQSDTEQTLRLAEAVKPLLEQEGLTNLMDFYMGAGRTLVNMMHTGVAFDSKRALEMERYVDDKVHSLTKDLVDFVGREVNWNSPKQVSELLFDELGVPENILDDKSRNPRSTDKFVLEAHTMACQDLNMREFFKALQDWRKFSKMNGTYLRPLQNDHVGIDGRIHPFYRLTGTATGRISCSEPNLQNIANDPIVASCFVPSPGFRFAKFDYKQLELVLAAWYAGETSMLEAFEAGRDLHTAVLAKMRGAPYDETVGRVESGEWATDRRFVKNVHFAVLYGGGPGALIRQARMAGIDLSWGEAQNQITEWFETYPKIANWIEARKLEAHENGEVVSPTGMRRRVPEIVRGGYEGKRAERQAVNALIQGLAAQCTLAGLVAVEEALTNVPGARMVMTVHDSVILEYPECSEEAIKNRVSYVLTNGVRDAMMSRFGFGGDLPLAVDAEYGLTRLAGED